MHPDSGRAAHVVLIVGHGLIGGAVVRLLKGSSGLSAASIGLRQRQVPGYLALDLANETGRAGLEKVVEDLRPRCVVLVHGPSDVTHVNENEADAAAVHCGVAEIVARSGVPAVLVSTDNVFPGTRGMYRPDEPPEPANGYGRVKALAENVLLSSGSTLVLRVSLVYGWVGPGLRITFAQRCLQAAVEGRAMAAPTDQMFTPIHVRDVAAVIAGACKAVPQPSGIRHLAGPLELSRYEFARLAYRLAGTDPDLVSPCRRRDTEWASRPRFSSLALSTPTGPPGPAGWRPMDPQEGLSEMLATRPEDPRGPTARPQPLQHSASGWSQ